jgi:hypothetical protein
MKKLVATTAILISSIVQANPATDVLETSVSCGKPVEIFTDLQERLNMKPFAKGAGNMFVESWEAGLLTYPAKIRILVDSDRKNWSVISTITYEGVRLSCVVAGGSDFESNFTLTDPELIGDGI